MEKQNLLVIFSADWADEFDVNGFAITTKEIWEDSVEKFKSAELYTSHYFGTNEGWESDEFDDYWLDNYTVKEITAEERETIINLFDHEFGEFPWPHSLVAEDDDDIDW